MTTTPFPSNGPTKIALSYAAMKRNKGFTKTDLFKCFHNKFRRPSDAENSLNILYKNGFIEPLQEVWKITPQGHQYLRSISKDYFRKNS